MDALWFVVCSVQHRRVFRIGKGFVNVVFLHSCVVVPVGLVEQMREHDIMSRFQGEGGGGAPVWGA